MPLIVTPPVGASLTLATAAVVRAGHALGRALAVGVARHHSTAAADIGLAERVGGPGRAGDVHAAALPLVADRAQPVGIGQRVRRRQRLVLRRLVPLIVTLPVGASLTLATAAVAALATLSAVPWPSV